MSTGEAQEGLSAIFSEVSGNTVIVALDASSISGPEAGLRYMETVVEQAVAGEVNAILGFPGMFKHYRELIGDTASILNLTLSTEGPDHLNKVQVASVAWAQALGLTGVSVHVNTTSPQEGKMLEILGRTAEECHELGMPLLAHMYPRRLDVNGKDDHYTDLQAKDPEAYAKLVRHAARIAADLGADIIKVAFTGDVDTFHTVVESTYGLPVIMAGGSRLSVPKFLHNAYLAMQAGARGVAVGRNFFEHDRIDNRNIVLNALNEVVHNDYEVDDALADAEHRAGSKLS